MADILLSIITATYRDLDALTITTESLRSLTSADFRWEHVVVDSSPEINMSYVNSLGPEWPLLHVTEPPRGVYSALNSGSNSASGKYLWFLNAGDSLISPERLKSALALLECDSRVDLLACSVERVREGHYQYCATPHKSFLFSILGGSTCLIHQGVLYRKSAFDKVGNFNVAYRIASDHHHYWRCFIAHLGLATTTLRLARFDVSGLSETNYKDGFKELRRVHQDVAPQLSFTVRALNYLLFYYVYSRTVVLKSIQKSKYREWLRPMWLQWKRRADRRTRC